MTSLIQKIFIIVINNEERETKVVYDYVSNQSNEQGTEFKQPQG